MLLFYHSFLTKKNLLLSVRPSVGLLYNNKSFISDNSPYGYKKIYKTHIINKLKIIRTNGNQ